MWSWSRSPGSTTGGAFGQPAAGGGAFGQPAAGGCKRKSEASDKAVTTHNFQGGATVVRGPDWKWQDQDGGAGNTGILGLFLDLEGWASVQWQGGSANKYRVATAQDLMYHSESNKKSWRHIRLPFQAADVASVRQKGTIGDEAAASLELARAKRMSLEPRRDIVGELVTIHSLDSAVSKCKVGRSLDGAQAEILEYVEETKLFKVQFKEKPYVFMHLPASNLRCAAAGGGAFGQPATGGVSGASTGVAFGAAQAGGECPPEALW